MPGHEFVIASGGGLQWLECSALARIPRLVHAFGTRCHRADARKVGRSSSQTKSSGRIERDQKLGVQTELLLRQVDAAGLALARLRQVHSDAVFQVRKAPRGRLEYRQHGLAPSNWALVTLKGLSCSPAVDGTCTEPALAGA